MGNRMKNKFIDRYQTKINLIYNIVTFIINAFIGLVLPSFLIKELGLSTYSLIPLSMSITGFMIVVTISINGTLSRFLSLEFENNISEVNKTFSTAFFTLVGLFVLISPLIGLFILRPTLFLNIETQDIGSARILFSTIIVAFILNSFASLFNSIAYVKNRINLQNISLIINRLGIIVFLAVLFLMGYITVEAYGVATLLAILFSFIYSYRIAKKLYPQLKVKYQSFTKEKFRNLFQLGFWLIVNQIGVLFFLQTDILIVNKFLGSEDSGVFGTLIQWSFLIRTIIGVFSTVFGPITLGLYASNETDRLVSLTKVTSKLLGIMGAILSVVILYFSKDILGVWLGRDFEEYAIILQVMVFHLGINLAYSSIINLNIAYDKAKIPGIVTLLTGLLNIALGILLIKYTSMGMVGVAVAGGISLTIKNLVFTPLYTAKIMNIKWFVYVKTIVPSLLITILGVGLAYVYPSSLLNLENVFQLVFAIGIFGIAFVILAWFLLCKDEKRTIIGVVRSKVR